MTRYPLLVLVCIVTTSACSRNDEIECESTERYVSATTVPPIRVPDDLTVPDETDALRVPDRPPPRDVPVASACLETPPDFFSGQPGGGA